MHDTQERKTGSKSPGDKAWFKLRLYSSVFFILCFIVAIIIIKNRDSKSETQHIKNFTDTSYKIKVTSFQRISRAMQVTDSNKTYIMCDELALYDKLQIGDSLIKTKGCTYVTIVRHQADSTLVKLNIECLN